MKWITGSELRGLGLEGRVAVVFGQGEVLAVADNVENWLIVERVADGTGVPEKPLGEGTSALPGPR